MSKYVNAQDVAKFIEDGKKVGSCIVGAVGKVLIVEDNFLYIGVKHLGEGASRWDKIKASKGCLPFSEANRVVAVENADGSITLWNEEFSPSREEKQVMITSKNLDRFISWANDGMHVHKFPTREELKLFTPDSFIDFFTYLKSESTTIAFNPRMQCNDFIMNVAFELVKRLDTTPTQISNDFRSHRDSWLAALEAQKRKAGINDDGDGSYWSHEIRAFNRAFDHLLKQGFEEIEVPKLESESSRGS